MHIFYMSKNAWFSTFLFWVVSQDHKVKPSVESTDNRRLEVNADFPASSRCIQALSVTGLSTDATMREKSDAERFVSPRDRCR